MPALPVVGVGHGVRSLWFQRMIMRMKTTVASLSVVSDRRDELEALVQAQDRFVNDIKLGTRVRPRSRAHRAPYASTDCCWATSLRYCVCVRTFGDTW